MLIRILKLFLLTIFASASAYLMGNQALAQSAVPQFSVLPAKQEIGLNAGEHAIRNLYIRNNLGRPAQFRLEVEDIAGGKDGEDPLKLYGRMAGPYSLRSLIFLDKQVVQVGDGQTVSVPVMISVPDNVKPGGRYGGIFVSEIKAGERGQAKITTRLGSLLFLTVKGDAVRFGQLKKFNVIGGPYVLRRDPINFQTVFENSGAVNLNPSGIIEITKRSGKSIETIPVTQWYVLPSSVRTKTTEWNHYPFFGRFTAKLSLYPGYGDSPAEAVYHFTVFPLYPLLKIVVVMFIAAAVIRFVVQYKRHP